MFASNSVFSPKDGGDIHIPPSWFRGAVIVLVAMLLLLLFCKEVGSQSIPQRPEIQPVIHYRLPDLDFAIEQAKKRNVLLEGPKGACSAVIIDTNKVLSAGHCWEETMSISGKVVKVLKKEIEPDLMLMEVETGKFPKLKLAKEVKLGETVFYIGSPMGHKGTLSIGRVVFLGHSGIHSDTLAIRGFSGSALYNLMGELLGIQNQLEGEAGIGQMMAVAIPYFRIEEFLEDK